MFKRLTGKSSLAIAAVAALAACADSSSVPTSPVLPADFAANADLPAQAIAHMRGFGPPNEEFNQARPGGDAIIKGAIIYHNGPIMRTPQVAAVYWGTSTIYTGGPTPGATGSAAEDGSLIGYFLSNLGASPRWAINHTYSDGEGFFVAASLPYVGFSAVNAAPPAAPTDAQIQAMLNAEFNSPGRLAKSANTIYAVFTGPGVNLGGGFGSQYCAYHTYYNSGGTIIKYAAMPYNQQYPGGCTAGPSPNGDAAADAEVNTLTHELDEAATDPQLNAWYDRRGYENADKCAWTFGTTGSSNISVGTKRFLVQQNWTRAGGCVSG